MKQLTLDKIYETDDIRFHEFLYNNGFYETNTRIEYSDDFDMWSYPIEENNVKLIDWVKSKGYRPPSQNCWWATCTPETRKHLENYVFKD